jgi:hypothetical protein
MNRQEHSFYGLNVEGPMMFCMAPLKRIFPRQSKQRKDSNGRRNRRRKNPSYWSKIIAGALQPQKC